MLRAVSKRGESDEDDPFPGCAPVELSKLPKYKRGKKLDVRNALRKAELRSADKKIQQSVQQAVRTEVLLPEEAGFIEAVDDEDTYRFSQNDIAASVDITSSTKYFSLNLPDFGPYRLRYSRDGRSLLLGGKRGHVAAMDWVTKRLLCEMNVMESVHDVCWLHLTSMFATAQKEFLHVYDTKGTEIHVIKELYRVTSMEFLPYHYLLVAASEKGFLSWLDVSVGKMIAHTYTNAGRLNILSQNPYNAVVVTGHPNGTISMWSPNVQMPLVRKLCHIHPITAVSIDSQGKYMATASVDRSLRLWDIRNLNEESHLYSYKLRSAASSLCFSQRGLLCAAHGSVIEVYKDCYLQHVSAPYLRHVVSSSVVDTEFCPYEDVLGIGHGRGFASVLIPGAGEPNFDAFESNPFMTKSQRREMEVKSLLEKVQPDLITLDPSHLGRVNVPSLKEKIEKKKALLHVKPPKIEFEPPKKMKGRSKSVKAFKRKKAVIEGHKRTFIKEAIKQKKKKYRVKSKDEFVSYDVLDRFKPKS